MKRKVIVITGGPSGGKTTLIEAIKKELGPQVMAVPEAASLLYRGGFLRRATSLRSKARAQRAIYFVQRELEGLALDEPGDSLIVCDRGSLDGLAYWPEDFHEKFEDSLETKLSDEINRYDWVLHLDTASAHQYDSSNPVRIESFEDAWKLNEKIKKAWSSHPRQLIVPPNTDFFSKMALCLRLIRGIMAEQTYESLLQELP